LFPGICDLKDDGRDARQNKNPGKMQAFSDGIPASLPAMAS